MTYIAGTYSAAEERLKTELSMEPRPRNGFDPVGTKAPDSSRATSAGGCCSNGAWSSETTTSGRPVRPGDRHGSKLGNPLMRSSAHSLIGDICARASIPKFP